MKAICKKCCHFKNKGDITLSSEFTTGREYLHYDYEDRIKESVYDKLSEEDKHGWVKYPQLTLHNNWGMKHCHHKDCFEDIPGKLDFITGERNVTSTRTSGCFQFNENFDCKRYKPKWYVRVLSYFRFKYREGKCISKENLMDSIS